MGPAREDAYCQNTNKMMQKTMGQVMGFLVGTLDAKTWQQFPSVAGVFVLRLMHLVPMVEAKTLNGSFRPIWDVHEFGVPRSRCLTRLRKAKRASACAKPEAKAEARRIVIGPAKFKALEVRRWTPWQDASHPKYHDMSTPKASSA